MFMYHYGNQQAARGSWRSNFDVSVVFVKEKRKKAEEHVCSCKHLLKPNRR